MFYLLFKVLRFIFSLIDVVLITTFTFVCALLPRAINKYFIQKLFRLVCWSFIHLIGRSPHIHEKFKPPLPKQYIVISNHPSGYDIMLLNALFPVNPLAKEGVRKWFLLGRIAEAAGTVFVKREHKSSRRAAKDACLGAIEEGKNILIFPEGGCFGKQLRDFKYGAFDISFVSGIPILPVYLQYEAENCFEWGDYGFIHHVLNLIKAVNKSAHCYIFDPIHPQSFPDHKAYAEYVHKLYATWESKYRSPDDDTLAPLAEFLEEKHQPVSMVEQDELIRTAL